MSRDIEALIALIEARHDHPFRWRPGSDCTFALACAKAQTGRDILADLAPWRTRREARAVAEELGGFEAALDARLTRIPPALAQRGDIAGLPERLFGVRLMVVEGETLVGPGTRGLERLPRGEMVMAWSVGDKIDG